MDAYPESKVILTTRDPVRWFNSVKNSIYQSRRLYNDPIVRLYLKFQGGTRQWECAQKVSAGTICFCTLKWLNIPTGRWIIRIVADLFDKIEKGEEESTTFFKEWISEVEKSVPKERLLVFEVKDGWGPLCQFLDCPQPDSPFPNVNDTASIEKDFSTLRRNSRIFFGVVSSLTVTLAGVFLYKCYLWNQSCLKSVILVCPLASIKKIEAVLLHSNSNFQKNLNSSQLLYQIFYLKRPNPSPFPKGNNFNTTPLLKWLWRCAYRN